MYYWNSSKSYRLQYPTPKLAGSKISNWLIVHMFYLVSQSCFHRSYIKRSLSSSSSFMRSFHIQHYYVTNMHRRDFHAWNNHGVKRRNATPRLRKQIQSGTWCSEFAGPWSTWGGREDERDRATCVRKNDAFGTAEIAEPRGYKCELYSASIVVAEHRMPMVAKQENTLRAWR